MQAVFRGVITHCRADYSWTGDDTRDYLPGWTEPTPDNWRRLSVTDCYLDYVDGNSTSLRYRCLLLNFISPKPRPDPRPPPWALPDS